MLCILDENVALRSWKNVPFAYCVKGEGEPRRLKPFEYLYLLRCDGMTELEEDDVLRDLQRRGLIHEAKPGQRLSPWQEALDCDNPMIPFISIEITQRCNCNCLHCFNAVDLDVPRAELTLGQICDILDQARACGIQSVLLSGGEPMLHPHFMQIIREVHNRGMMVYAINTNATFLTRDILDQMAQLGMRPAIQTSFDGLGFHDVMRNARGCEQRALDAIALCVEKNQPMLVQMNINSLNMDTILPSLRLLDDMGVRNVRIIRTSESPRWNLTMPGTSIGWSEYYRRSVEICAELNGAGTHLKVEFWPFLSADFSGRWFRCWHARYNEQSFKPSRPLCRRINGNVSVGAQGNLYPCLQMSGFFDAAGVRLGNIFETPLQALLNEGTYAAVAHARMSDRLERNERCKDCPFLTYCAGGSCPVIAILFGRGYFGPNDSACIFHRDGWHAKVASALPGWTDQTPMPDDIDTTYLKQLQLEDAAGDYLDKLRESLLAFM